jgi:hypothetical protein
VRLYRASRLELVGGQTGAAATACPPLLVSGCTSRPRGDRVSVRIGFFLFIAYRTGLQKTISPSNQTRFTFHHFSFSSSQVFKRRKSGQGNGTVGKLTRGLISRTDYYAHTVTLALIPFMNPTLYQAHCTGMAWTPPSS